MLDVAVLASHWGLGIGTRLMEAAEALAARRVQLDAAAANADALRSYRSRLGYRPLGVLLHKPLPADHTAMVG